jgi:hypothetical protein
MAALVELGLVMITLIGDLGETWSNRPCQQRREGQIMSDKSEPTQAMIDEINSIPVEAGVDIITFAVLAGRDGEPVVMIDARQLVTGLVTMAQSTDDLDISAEDALMQLASKLAGLSLQALAHAAKAAIDQMINGHQDDGRDYFGEGKPPII